MAKINGKEVNNVQGIRLSDYLKKEGFKISLIAVEYNGEILPKDQYDNKVISENDVIEVVSFVGGG